MRQLVVHIGNPKAGSMSLQQFLHAHHQELERKGILYPVIDGSRSHGALARLHSGKLITAKQVGMTFPAVRGMIEKSDATSVVISSEFFVAGARHPGMIAEIRKLARATGLALKVVAFVRPQHHWINSAYTQSAKRLKTTVPFQQFFDNSFDRQNYNPMSNLQAWMEIPEAEFIALPFSSAHLKPNMETVFMRATGLAADLSEVLDNPVPVMSNKSPGPMTIEASLRAARHLDKAENVAWKAKKLASKVIGHVADQHGWNKVSFSGITEDDKLRVWRHFEEANNAFAQAVWGRSWGEVFAEDFARKVTPNIFDRGCCSDADYALLEETVREAVRG